ncbi:hypothetical protein GCM10009730_32700 [Streptomyces albidochromogenes]|uniref:YxiG-like protein n=1 Tax=Streptomyces albidochromogenes TaxID=329524 RepID=UPI00110F8E99
MRDYEVIFDVGCGPHHGEAPTYLRCLFRYCVEARCETFLAAKTWRASLDDRLLDRETADPDLGGIGHEFSYRSGFLGGRLRAPVFLGGGGSGGRTSLRSQPACRIRKRSGCAGSRSTTWIGVDAHCHTLMPGVREN